MVPSGSPVGPITGNDPAQRCDLTCKRGLTHRHVDKQVAACCNTLIIWPRSRRLGGNKTDLVCRNGAATQGVSSAGRSRSGNCAGVVR